MNIRIEIPKYRLEQLYVNKKLSIYKVAKIFNVSPVLIHKRIHEYGIPSRSISEGLRGRIPWNKGKHLSEKTKRKLSKIWRKFWRDPKFIEKMDARNKILSERMKGEGNPMRSLQSRKKRSEKMNGRHHTKEVKEKSRIRAIKQLISGEFKNKISSIELKVEKELRRKNIYYKKQLPILNRTLVDFYLPRYKVAIYCDGIFWHKSSWAEKEGVVEKDIKQTKFLSANGYKVFRFSETEINTSVEKCVEKILKYNRL